jgi:hypothetical protein
MISSTQGWAFQSPLSLVEMKVRLDASAGRAWVIGDSHFHGDYLGCRVEADMVVRIYDTGSSIYVANLQYYSLDDDVVSADVRIEQAESTLLEETLPLIKATNVAPAEPIE